MSRTRTRAAAAVVEDAPPERPDRKQAILLAAEKLFASHGYHAVSLRQIAEEAGVPLALVGYYYGQKHELFQAIFQHWSKTLEERLVGLNEAMAAPPRQRLQRLVVAFTTPVLKLRASPEGEYYAMLVARELYHSREETEQVLRAHFDPLAHAYIDALEQLLPGADRATAAWAYQFMLGTLLHHLSDNRVERLSRGQARAGDPAVAGLLQNYIVGGLRAAFVPRAAATKAD
ncbi:TetR family transcriptional regulator [Aquincola tertiaricarbonis]|uniref:TetR family transcriptional regulator n=1 Tax=Aquincola tertiaricarbonis TaxID=391953 RepID=A0ABY4RYL4_AQUTE|nr:TetR/AcrR family transcriptional regulator [Aquincola tertiaricarbonis]URI05851.1 TetR family transcriptional regulator [Aquincola tertiaricarbonis]